MANPIHVALIQYAPADDRGENLSRLTTFIRDATVEGAQLVVLPELHNHRYFCQTEDVAAFELAETIPGPTTEYLGALARETETVIVGSVFERRGAGVFHNTAVVLDSDGSLAGRYRKMHIPDDPGYHEKFYFAPGDLGFIPIATRLGNIGVLVCWDQWYPEAARLMALSGAEILVYPTAIGWDDRDDEGERNRQRDAWITVQRGHGVTNSIPVISCNRVGIEPAPNGGAGIRFWGSSFIAGPQGEMVAQGSQTDAEIINGTVDLEAKEQIRRAWPYFRDRRIDAYGGLTQRFCD